MDPSVTSDRAAVRSGAGADAFRSDTLLGHSPPSSDMFCIFSLLGSSAEAEVSVTSVGVHTGRVRHVRRAEGAPLSWHDGSVHVARGEVALCGTMGPVNGRAPGRGRGAVPGIRNSPEACQDQISSLASFPGACDADISQVCSGNSGSSCRQKLLPGSLLSGVHYVLIEAVASL